MKSYNIKKIFTYNNYIFNFNNLKFWNRFYLISFICIIFLCFISIFSTDILQKITNPIHGNPNSVIIEIYPENIKEKNINKQEIITKYLKSNPLVESFEVKSQNELLGYMKKFSPQSKGKINQNLPLPIIIVANLKDSSAISIQNLRLNLSQKVKNIYLDTQNDLISRLIRPLNTAQYFTQFIPILSVAILMIILFLIIYALLFSNKSTIETLLILGMFKSTLFKHFSIWVFEKTLHAGLLSFILINLILVIMKYIFFINIILIPLNKLLLFFIIILLILPLCASILSIIFIKKILLTNFKS